MTVQLWIATRLRTGFLASSLVFTLSMSGSVSEIPDGNEGELKAIKSALIGWSMSLKTFSGRYHLAYPSEDVPGEKHVEITMRWDGVNAYSEMRSGSPDKPDTEIHTFHQGVLDTYVSQEGRPGYGVTNGQGYAGLPWPWGVYITPEEIFGRHHAYSLADVLGSGESRLLERHGERILSHDNRTLGRSVDIFVDEQNRVKRFEWVRRPLSHSQDELRDLWPGDLFDVRIPKSTLELSNYTEIEGIPFPLDVFKTWWRLDESQAEQVNLMYEAGQIDQEELIVRLHTTPVHEFTHQTFSLDEARLNLPLSDEDFEIDWPSGAEVHDKEEWKAISERRVASVYKGRRRRLYAITALIGVVSAFGLVASGFLLLRRRSAAAK